MSENTSNSSLYPPPPIFYKLYKSSNAPKLAPPKPLKTFFTKLGVPQQYTLQKHSLAYGVPRLYNILNKVDDDENNIISPFECLKGINFASELKILNQKIYQQYIELYTALISQDTNDIEKN